MNRLEALQKLMDISVQIDDLSSQADDIVREHFPSEIGWVESYKIFAMTYSVNPYDQTMETLIKNIERQLQEEN